MSIVVAVKKGNEVVIAADSQLAYGSNKASSGNVNNPKIRRIGSVLIGSVGWGIYDDILNDYLLRKKSVRLNTSQEIFRFFMEFWHVLRNKYSLIHTECKDEKSPFGDLDQEFLIVTTKRIFFVGSNMSVTEFLKFHAIGAGAEFALGAMHVLYEQGLDARELASKAVATVIANNLYCGGEIQVLKP